MLTKTAALILFLSFCKLATAQYHKYTFSQPKMGSPFNLSIYGTDSTATALAAMQAFAFIDTLNEIYSDYLPYSELSLLCATAGTGKWVAVSEPLFSIVQKAVAASKVSRGTFDITISPVVRLWRQGRKEKKLPDSSSINTALQRCGYKKIRLDNKHRSILLSVNGMQLDLGGIAKGETAQRVINKLAVMGYPYALIDAGGDIVAGDVPPGVQAWRIGINMPESEDLMEKKLLLQNVAVTTSGDLYQYVDFEGKRYSHIVDPRTGWAITNTRNVTVISADGTDADWLTKACSILPVKKALQLVQKFKHTEVQIATLQNGTPVFYRTKGFVRYFEK